MTNPTGEIGQLREEELPVVRLTPMLVWHEHYPIGGPGSRVLAFRRLPRRWLAVVMTTAAARLRLGRPPGQRHKARTDPGCASRGGRAR